MRLLAAILGVAVALLFGAATTCLNYARAEDAAGEPPAEPVSEEENTAAAEDEPETAVESEDAAETANEEEASEVEDGGEEDELPEGVRRRPRTGEQERWYKQRKTREDPFLNPPGGLDGPNEIGFYNPADWLREEVYYGVSRYMVQDAGGVVVGYTTLAIEREADPVLGEFIRLRRIDDIEPATQIEVWLYAGTFKPRTKEIVIQVPPTGGSPPDAAPDNGNGQAQVQKLYEDTQRLDVDYLFDRMTIVHRVGGITARRQMRQLPFSYDLDELPFLMRQLIVREGEWPFEAALCDPANETHIPMSIAQPQRIENVMDADVQQLDCYEFTVRLGESTHTYLVQRIPPYKLVKFADGTLTYTLSGYMEQL